jgi:predicted AlkP superfamily phosphohydrolase/phosphomutase
MVIGLDGLTFTRLLPLVERGELPNFARLLACGARGMLLSVSNMTTGPTWASFSTGCLPQNHGIHHDFHHLAGSYRLQPTRGSDCQRPFFWEIAGEIGYRCVVLNVPLTYPVRPVNGVILAGIDAPSERATGFAYPSDSYQKLRRHGVDYLIDCGLASYMQTGRLADGYTAVLRETEGRTRSAEYFLQQSDWNLFVVVYSLPDVWQHYFWTAPAGSPGAQQLDDGYRLVDEHLGRLLALLPAHGMAIICSDHGFGRLLGTRNQINNRLAGQGLLRYAAERRTPMRRLQGWLLAQTRKRISFRRRQQLLAAAPAVRRIVETQLRIGGIDWTQTQVYAALDHLELWINVRGRQPAGVVDPSEYDAVCQRVSAMLLNWRDEKTGAPYLKEVNRVGAEAGQNLGHSLLIPDLALTWNEDATTPGLHPLITGDHTPDGALLVAGPGVQVGWRGEACLTDIAPIVLHALGVTTPPYMDGCVPAGLFNGA